VTVTDIVRFDRVTRYVHWATAALFCVLMLTGAALYAGPISLLVGHRDVVRLVHVVAGIALPVPIIVGVIGRWGARLRRDLGSLNRGSADKFNLGQRLNATFLGASIVVMLATGSVMKWFSLFPLDWRTGATFVHDWFALGIWLSVGAHLYFAFRDPVALGGMRRGTVTARWARTTRPAWYEHETGRPAQRLKQNDAGAATADR
jgi:formate dehydrogenase subunit gamma